MPESAYLDHTYHTYHAYHAYSTLSSSSFQHVAGKPTPSPSPAPTVTHRYPLSPRNRSLGPPSSRVAKSSRTKAQPMQAQTNWGLLSRMDLDSNSNANQAEPAPENPLHPASASEKEDASDSDLNNMDSLSPRNATHVVQAQQPTPNVTDTHAGNLERLATITLESTAKPTNTHRDSVIDDARTFSPNPPRYQQPAVTNGRQHSIAPTTSPHLQPLAIPLMRGPDKLPALQAPSPAHDGSAAALHHHQPLPPFRHLDDIARSAASEQDMGRPNGFPHRQSISSVGQSPTSMVRQLSISSHSTSTPIALLNASSPMSAASDSQRGDIFLKNGGASVFGTTARRPSHATSENGSFLAPLLHPTSSQESHYSTEAASPPGGQPVSMEPRARHRSIDDALTCRVLPLPLGSGIQTIPSQGGSFKCEYPHCNAPPFQTQYLLNSHTNVHSQNRPHYCPVKACPRGEGGKGFKRKNEMIRHGLVHQSPGYVCPFCPDREHKYPRPDNLQRYLPNLCLFFESSSCCDFSSLPFFFELPSPLYDFSSLSADKIFPVLACDRS